MNRSKQTNQSDQSIIEPITHSLYQPIKSITAMKPSNQTYQSRYQPIDHLNTSRAHACVDLLLWSKTRRRTPREDILRKIGVSQLSCRHEAHRETRLVWPVIFLQHTTHDLPLIGL